MTILRSLLVLFVFASPLGPARCPWAADPVAQGTLRIYGAGVTETTLDLAALRALPHTTVRAREHDAPETTFEGVPLAALLEKVGAPLGEKLRGRALRLGVLVQAADGYSALFSLAELDPRMNSRAVILADRKADGALSEREGALRLVVADEGRPARWVRQVIALQLVCAGSNDAADCLAPPAPPAPAR